MRPETGISHRLDALNFDRLLMALRRADWHKQEAQHLASRLVRIVACRQRPPGTWSTTEFSFLRLAFSGDGRLSQMPIVEVSEDLMLREHELLIDWLLDSRRNNCSVRDAPIIRESLRPGRLYSYNKDGLPTLQYIPPAKVDEALDSLQSLLCSSKISVALVTMIIAFAVFIGIHPFVDGNGRASRLLLRKGLQREGLWDSSPLPLAFLLYRDRQTFVDISQSFLQGQQSARYVPYMLRLIGAAAELALLNDYLIYLRKQ